MSTMNLDTAGNCGAENALAATRSIASVGGVITAAGACSVVVTSIFYALSPLAAIAPVLQILPDAARAGAAAGAATMKVAGTSGAFGDLVMGVGTLLLAIDRSLRGRPVAAAGWAFIMMSLFVFEIVDALVGFVLPPSAAAADIATFEAFRRLYGVLFLVGTVLFGVGAVLAMARERGSIAVRSLAWLCIADGAVAVGAALATFVGLPFAVFVGVAIGVGAVLFVIVGARIAVAPDA